MVTRLACAVLVAACIGVAVGAQSRPQVEQFVAAHRQAIVRELVELLSIPNVAADRDNIQRNADLLRDLFAKRGFTAEILETSGNPLVFAELRVPGAQPHAPLLRALRRPAGRCRRAGNRAPVHVRCCADRRMEDGGQEIANFLSLTSFPPEARLYARSASDDKAPIMALLAAVDALSALNQRPTSNVKVILDGEEEARSPSLAATMGRYRDRYRADLMLILDGPLHQSGKPTLSFGARGNLVFQLTAFGPKFALHSGHYGNWAPNPAMDLVQLLASMKDANGRVLVSGFYDDVPPLTAASARFSQPCPIAATI